MALAVAAVVLAALTIGLGVVNQSQQDSLARRQEYAGQTPQVARVVQVVAQTLAEAAQRSDDEKLRDLLTRAGFTIRVTPTPGPAPTPAPIFTSVQTPAPPVTPAPEASPAAPVAAPAVPPVAPTGPATPRSAVNTAMSPDPPSGSIGPARPAVVATPTRAPR